MGSQKKHAATTAKATGTGRRRANQGTVGGRCRVHEEDVPLINNPSAQGNRSGGPADAPDFKEPYLFHFSSELGLSLAIGKLSS